jgi:hypothetical protein
MVAVTLFVVVLVALLGLLAARHTWSSGRVRAWALVLLTLPAAVAGLVLAQQITEWLGYDPSGPEDLPRSVEVLGAAVFLVVAVSAPLAAAVVGRRASRTDPDARAPTFAGLAIGALIVVVTVWLNR